MARDPGKEPLEMISGDVVELTKMLYAEREAHAAEVTRLRSALQIAGWRLERGYWSTRTFIDQKVPGWIRGDDSVSYPMLKGVGEVKAALATPSSAAVEAVENALKAAHDVLGDYDSSEEGRIGNRSAWALRAALAAYEEALRGR